MYRYKLDGTFLDMHRFSEKTRGKFCFDDEGNIYNVISPDKIGVYRIQNLKRR